MRTAHVQLVHDSTVVSFADARRVVRALRTQVRRDFAPVFGVQADVELVRRGEQDRRAWQIAIVDDEAYVFVRAAPQAGAAPLRYRAPPASVHHVIASLAQGGRYNVRAARDGDQCRIELTPGGARAASSAGLLVLDLGPGCALR